LIVSGSFRISEIGGSSLVIALAFSAMAVLYVISSPPLGHLSDTYGRARPLIVLLLLATVALLVLMMVTMPLPAAALIAVGGTLLTLVGGPSFALLTDAVQAQGKSTVEATFLMNLYWGPSAALGAILGGIFHGAVGAELSFGFLAVVLVASAGLVARYARSAT
jgi:MFS family permease